MHWLFSTLILSVTLVRLSIDEIFPSMKNFFCSFWLQELQHFPKKWDFVCLRLGRVSTCWVCSLSDYSLFSFGLFFTPFGRPLLLFIIYSPSSSSFFTIIIRSSRSLSRFILVLTSSMDFVSKRWTNSWKTLSSLMLLSPEELICFLIFFAPLGLPLPLFSWNFLLDSSINSSSDDFSTLSFLRFLLPLGLPLHRWSMLLLNVKRNTSAAVILNSVNRKNHLISHDWGWPWTQRWTFWTTTP